MPLSPSTSVMTAPDSWAGPPASAISVCVSRPMNIRSPPGRMCRRMAISLHIVPLGRKTRRLVAQQRGDPLLERARGRIRAALLVADLGRGDGRAHAAVGRVCVSE